VDSKEQSRQKGYSKNTMVSVWLMFMLEKKNHFGSEKINGNCIDEKKDQVCKMKTKGFGSPNKKVEGKRNVPYRKILKTISQREKNAAEIKIPIGPVSHEKNLVIPDEIILYRAGENRRYHGKQKK